MRVAVGILVVVVILLCAGIIGLGVVLGGAASTIGAAATPTREVPVSTAAAASFDQKIAALPGGRGQVVLTEAEVTSKLNEVLATSGAPAVRNLTVRLDPGVISANGRVNVGFGTSNVEMRLALGVANGQITGRLERLTVGGVALPQAIQNQVIAAALGVFGVQVPPGTDLTNLSNLRVPADLRTLQVREGDILLELGR